MSEKGGGSVFAGQSEECGNQIRLGQVSVLSRVEKEQTEWKGKVEDMTGDRMVKKCLWRMRQEND